METVCRIEKGNIFFLLTSKKEKNLQVSFSSSQLLCLSFFVLVGLTSVFTLKVNVTTLCLAPVGRRETRNGLLYGRPASEMISSLFPPSDRVVVIKKRLSNRSCLFD